MLPSTDVLKSPFCHQGCLSLDGLFRSFSPLVSRCGLVATNNYLKINTFYNIHKEYILYIKSNIQYRNIYLYIIYNVEYYC